MNLLILSLLMAFGGQTHIMAQVCIYQGEHRRARCSPNPSSTTGPVTSITSGTLTGFSCPPEECQPAHWECPAGFEMDTQGSYDHPSCHRIPHAFLPDFIRDPYPLWRMEAQFIRADRKSCVFGKVLLSDGATCITEETAGPTAAREPERTFTSGATRDIDSGPMLNQTPTVCLIGKDKPDFCASYQPIDVPAVQEPSKEPSNGPPSIMYPDGKYTKWCIDTTIAQGQVPIIWCDAKPPLIWSCADKSRSLESSVDGLKHWCHRSQQ